MRKVALLVLLLAGTFTGQTHGQIIEQQSSDALPTTLQASESDGGPAKITFERIIVMPDGQRYIEGVTPKALPAPDGDKDQ